MKKEFFICFSLFLIFSAKLHAQRFFVGELEGVAYIVNNGEQCKLTKGDYLDNESRIYIAPKSAIILQDSKKKKLPMIKGPKDGTLESILHNKKGVTYIKCSKEIFDYITGKIFDCFFTRTEDGKNVANANSKRSLSNEKDSTLSELDMGVLQIMNQFYKELED